MWTALAQVPQQRGYNRVLCPAKQKMATAWDRETDGNSEAWHWCKAPSNCAPTCKNIWFTYDSLFSTFATNEHPWQPVDFSHWTVLMLTVSSTWRFRPATVSTGIYSKVRIHALMQSCKHPSGAHPVFQHSLAELSTSQDASENRSQHCPQLFFTRSEFDTR